MSQPADAPVPEEPAQRKPVRRLGRIICWLGYWALLLLATHVPKPERITPSVPGLDKVAHLLTFGLLAGLGVWAWVLAEQGKRARRWMSWMIVLAVYTGLDEVLQPLTGRQADVRDWLANLLGCGLGLAVMWLWKRRRPTGWSVPLPRG